MKRNQLMLRLTGTLGVFALALSGCVSPSTFLSEDFLTSLGLGNNAANLPGEAPAVIIEIENRSGRTIEALVSWQGDGNLSSEREVVLLDGEKTAEVVICPVARMTLGRLGDLDSVGAIVRLTDGQSNAAFIEVEPFGRTLEDEINYQCGDAITFTIQPSNATLSGYQAFAYVRRSGAVLPTDDE